MNRSLKILIVRTGATEVSDDTYNLQEVGLARALAKRGHQCDVLYYTEHDESEYALDGDRLQSTVYRRRGRNLFGDAVYPDLESFASDYDVVQLAEYNRIQSVRYYSKHKNAVVYHGPYKFPVLTKRDFFRFCKYGLFDVIFNRRRKNATVPVISKSKLATDLLVSKGFKEVTTLGVGLDTAKLSYGIEPVQSERRFNLLFIGRLHPNKNLGFLLSVFRECIRDIDDLNLFIIGSGHGKYADKIKNTIENSECLKSHITYVESVPQSEIGAYFKSADLCILPSAYEIFGMVLLEAGYYGCPIVASSTGGALALSMYGEVGDVLDGFDIREWSRSIVSLLQEETRRHRCGLSLQRIVDEHFTWDSLADSFLEVYERVIV